MAHSIDILEHLDAATRHAYRRTVAGTVAGSLRDCLALEAGDTRSGQTWRALLASVYYATDTDRAMARQVAERMLSIARDELHRASRLGSLADRRDRIDYVIRIMLGREIGGAS